MENLIIFGVGILIQFAVNYFYTIQRINVLQEKITVLEKHNEKLDASNLFARIAVIENKMTAIENLLQDIKIDIKDLRNS